jgi:threonine synthase
MTDFRYFCSTCGRRYRRDEVRYLCPVCASEYAPGTPLVGVLTVEFDYAAIRRSFRMSQPDWSLFSAVEEEFFPKYPVGNTPFFRPPGLADATGFENLWIKNDGQNPSGSLKDRASFLVVAEANRLGETSVVTASTGNAASALAAVCAAAGRQAIIFVPARAPRAKLVQMLRHGARVIPVNGSYDDAFRLSLDFTAKYGGLNRNTAYHPLTIEGKKTAGMEICQQNGWKAPDAVIVPVGDGVIIAGVSKAFGDLQAAGVISHVPRLIAVQAEKSDAIHNFVKTGVYSNAENPATIADSISVSVPSNARLARVAILESGGCSLTVTDREILEGQRLLAEKAGIFAEPAASATAAALSKLRDGGILGRRDQVVLLVTGHGLKDVDAAMKCTRVPPAIDPTPDALEALAGKHASNGGGP